MHEPSPLHPELARLRRLVTAMLVADRMKPRSAWVMAGRLLATPAGRLVAREWHETQHGRR